jgi:hypothetical protein
VSFDAFETSDGSTPHFFGLAEEVQRQAPIAAFALLEGGDAFEASPGSSPPKTAKTWAEQAVARCTFVASPSATSSVARVKTDMTAQLSGNAALSRRLLQGRPLSVELLPPNPNWLRHGFPASVTANTSGLFWDDPRWPSARLALREDRLQAEAHLVFHELAHALAYLAFTAAERELLFRRFLPTYRTRQRVDEAFAVYSEREFVTGFSEEDERAPGIYGHTRRRWSEDHLFTRFVRQLYFPDKPLAGPKPASL